MKSCFVVHSYYSVSSVEVGTSVTIVNYSVNVRIMVRIVAANACSGDLFSLGFDLVTGGRIAGFLW